MGEPARDVPGCSPVKEEVAVFGKLLSSCLSNGNHTVLGKCTCIQIFFLQQASYNEIALGRMT